MLADGTCLNIVLDELGKTRPPEFCCDKLTGFKVTWVASSFMVMAMMNYGLSKGVIQGNVYMSFVGKDTLGDLPVGQAGMEDSRDGWF